MDPTRPEESVSKLGPVVQINEGRIQAHLDEVVRNTVEETLNALLELEADRLCGARRYERSEGRQDTRAGSYSRQLHTKAGEVSLKVPKLRSLPFETAIIERYRRRESSVEEALMEMYLAGVSVRRVEDITEALWGTRVSPSTVSELNQQIYAQIEIWRQRPLQGAHPYVYLDGLWLKRSWAGEVRNVAVLVAIGVDEEGFREVLAVAEGAKGGQGQLDGLSAPPKRARAERSAAVHLRPVPGAGGESGRVLSRGELAAMCGAFLPQRVDGGADQQGERSCCHAEGDPCAGGSGVGAGQSSADSDQAGADEAGESGGAGSGEHRGNVFRLRVSPRALEVPADE